MATPCVCISFKQFFLELYHGTTDNFRPGDGCQFQQYDGQHSDLVALTVQTSYKWFQITTSPPKAKNKSNWGRQNHPESTPHTGNQTSQMETVLTLVLREHAKNSTCPYGLQHRPKPHIRFDREFQTTLDQISHRAHAELLTMMVKQQEKEPSSCQRGHPSPTAANTRPVSRPTEFNQTPCCQQSQTQAQAAEEYT